jgi:hypothetical protein
MVVSENTPIPSHEPSFSDTSAPHGPIPDPRYKINTTVLIPDVQIENLHERDQGRCLITQEKDPQVIIQSGHIFSWETSERKVWVSCLPHFSPVRSGLSGMPD